MATASPQQKSNVDDVALQLRSTLDKAGFAARGIDELIGPMGRFHLERGEVAPVLRRLRDGSPLATLTRLFVVGAQCSAVDIKSFLDDSDLEAWCSANIVKLVRDQVVPLMRFEWFDDLLIASDPRNRAARRDYVMGTSGPSAALAGLTIRNTVGTTLDIGCGSGLQALAAASHSEQVNAYDVNPRAIFFTRFNACLNSISNVHSKQSDLFDLPVQVKADLVVSNPPYVISSGLNHKYRDSGREGDEVCSHLASLIPRLLAPSGFGQFMANWIVTGGEPWKDRLARWFEGSGCDVWVLHESTEEASLYVTRWLRETNRMALRGVGNHYERWMQYFEERGIAGVGYGLISMQRVESGDGSVWIDDAPDDYTFPCSSAMEMYLNRLRSISCATDAELLGRSWRTSPDLVIDEIRSLKAGSIVQAKHARLVRNLCWHHELTSDLKDVLDRCDGVTRLQEVIAGMAQANHNVESVLISTLMPRIRILLEHGLLVPE